jgi:hypothetical protein
MNPHRSMKNHFRTAALATAGLALCAASHAQGTPPVEPGLWQYTVKIRSQSGQIEGALSRAQAELAKLPPDQRRAIEQMMASRGVSLGADGNTTQVKACLTKEQAERGTVPVSVQRGQCTQKLISSDGSTSKMAFTCQTDPPSSGVGEVTFISRTAVSAKVAVDTVVEGKPERLNLSQEGKWLEAGCGGIPPLTDEVP